MSEDDGKLVRIKAMLDDLGAEVGQGKFEGTILKDLKLSVDQLRLSLWGIIASQDQNSENIPGADFGLETKLAEYRIKRTLGMLKELQADLQAGRIAHAQPDLRALIKSLAIVLEGATKLLQTRP